MIKKLPIAMAINTALAVSAAIAPQVALASSSTPGTVYDLVVWNGRILFHTTGTRTDAPSCQGVPGRWAIDARTPSGQAMLSALLTASASGKPVEIMGTGACADWGDTESVEWLRVL